MLLKVMYSTAQPVFWLFMFLTWASSWPFPAPSLIDTGQVQQLQPAPCSAQAVTQCQWKELWPGAAQGRNDLLTFVFVFSYVRLPLRRKLKKQPPLLPACSLALNGTGFPRSCPPVGCRGLEACMACRASLGGTSCPVPGGSKELGCCLQGAAAGWGRSWELAAAVRCVPRACAAEIWARGATIFQPPDMVIQGAFALYP